MKHKLLSLYCNYRKWALSGVLDPKIQFPQKVAKAEMTPGRQFKTGS